MSSRIKVNSGGPVGYLSALEETFIMPRHQVPGPSWPMPLIVGAVAVVVLLITGQPHHAIIVTVPGLIALGAAPTSA